MMTPTPRCPAVLRTLVLCVSLLMPWQSPAQDATADPAAEVGVVEAPLEEYRIELIVFEYGDALAGTTEDWHGPGDAASEPEVGPDEASEAVTGEAGEPLLSGELATPDDLLSTSGPVGEETVFRYIPLTEADLELVELFRRLRNAGDYQPLLHIAWQQPGYDRATAQPLDLERVGALPERLTGEATLYRSRFLHLILDLELRAAGRQDLTMSALEPDPTLDPVLGLEPDVYRLQERRKLKSGELHYYDHPRFGVLAKVTPVAMASEEGGGEPAYPGS